VTVCDDANEACPFFPGAKRHLHWPLADPSAAMGTEEERMEVFRSVRDRLGGFIEADLAGVRRSGQERRS
jgi:arsenate reductase (thioredoxin)